MFNIKDKEARKMISQNYNEFSEFRKVTNDLKFETILPLEKKVNDLDDNLFKFIHQLQDKIQQQDEIIRALIGHLGLVVHYVEPDHVGKYEILSKIVKEEDK